jgi:hypothetical protein
VLIAAAVVVETSKANRRARIVGYLIVVSDVWFLRRDSKDSCSRLG